MYTRRWLILNHIPASSATPAARSDMRSVAPPSEHEAERLEEAPRTLSVPYAIENNGALTHPGAVSGGLLGVAAIGGEKGRSADGGLSKGHE
jgi:hypothetical protein